MELADSPPGTVTANEKKLLQRLLDVWNMRSECLAEGVPSSDLEFPRMVPNMAVSRNEWWRIKQDCRLEFGLPCHPRKPRYRHQELDRNRHAESSGSELQQPVPVTPSWGFGSQWQHTPTQPVASTGSSGSGQAAVAMPAQGFRNWWQQPETTGSSALWQVPQTLHAGMQNHQWGLSSYAYPARETGPWIQQPMEATPPQGFSNQWQAQPMAATSSWGQAVVATPPQPPTLHAGMHDQRSGLSGHIVYQ